MPAIGRPTIGHVVDPFEEPKATNDVRNEPDMNDQNQRLGRLERKVDWILRIVGIQLVLCVGFALWYGLTYMFQLASTVTLVLIVAVPLLYAFRRYLPGPVLSALSRSGKFAMSSLARFKGRSIQAND